MFPRDKVNAYFSMYPADYFADTRHLVTAEQHGAYLLLILQYHRNGGPLPDDDAILASYTSTTAVQWRKLRAIMEKFFEIRDGQWHHHRCDRDIFKALSSYLSKKKGADTTNAQRHANRTGQRDAQRTLSDTDTARSATRSTVGNQESGIRNQESGPSYDGERETSEAQSDQGEGQKPGAEEPGNGPGGIPPIDLEPFKAQAVQAGMPNWFAEEWWLQWDAVAWLERGQPIRKPLSLLQNRWQRQQRPQGGEKNGAKNGGGGGARRDSAYGLKQRIEALQAQRDRCDRTTKEGRAEILEFNRQIEEMQRELGGGQ